MKGGLETRGAARMATRCPTNPCSCMACEAPQSGFILAETLVQNSTAGDNGTGGGTLN